MAEEEEHEEATQEDTMALYEQKTYAFLQYYDEGQFCHFIMGTWCPSKNVGCTK